MSRLRITRFVQYFHFQSQKRRLYSSQSHTVNGDIPTNTEQGGARPLFFQRSPQFITNHDLDFSLLTPYELRGTTSILSPHLWYLSPCLGAALASSPLVGNLMRFRDHQECFDDITNPLSPSRFTLPVEQFDHDILSMELSQVSFLSNSLFFQMIRESPIHVTRNKSMPASHLTPSLIANLLLQSLTDVQRNGKTTCIKESLKRDFGIRSNYINHDVHTGISLTRWMDLIVDSRSTSFIHCTMIPALWLVALWGVSTSRDSLIEYSQALIEYSQTLVPKASHVIDAPDDVGRKAKFVETDFSPQNLNEALECLVQYYEQPYYPKKYPDDDNRFCVETIRAAYALELVCAAIALQNQSSTAMGPILPNGYYTFDGGEVKADCVEVAIREIFYFLLWDELSQSLNLSRLPRSASRALVDILKAESDFHRDHSKGTSSARLDFGQLWFDVLSDRQECSYLSISPNQRLFELAPTIESISTALWSLLTENYEETLVENSSRSQPWKSLHDVSQFWLRQNPEQKLLVEQDTLRHFLSAEKYDQKGVVIKHEIVRLQLMGSPGALEIRLRCDWEESCGMAAVSRLSERRDRFGLSKSQAQKLHNVCLRGCSDRRIRAAYDWSLVLLCIALPQMEVNASGFPSLTIIQLLATPFGPDRRSVQLMNVEDNEKLALQQKDWQSIQLILKDAVLKLCDICRTYPAVGTQLLTLILHESPGAPEISEYHVSVGIEIERALLGLPKSALVDKSLLKAIEGNWACRGRPLSMLMQWRSGNLSWMSIPSGLNPSEWVDFVQLSRIEP